MICVMTLDTSLLAILMLAGWEWHPAAVAAFWLVFTTITGTYLSSNLLKVPKGAWFRQVCPCTATAAAAAAAAHAQGALRRSPTWTRGGLTCRCPGLLTMLQPLPLPLSLPALQPGAGHSSVAVDLPVALGSTKEAAVRQRQQN